MNRNHALLLAALLLLISAAWLFRPAAHESVDAAQPPRTPRRLDPEPNSLDRRPSAGLRAPTLTLDSAALDSAVPAERRVRVLGRCVNAAGWPVPGVVVGIDKVLCRPERLVSLSMFNRLSIPRAVHTDAAGRFELDLEVDVFGEAQLNFDHQAYGICYRPLTLVAGGTRDLGDVRLDLACTMVLYIRDEAGLPVSGAWKTQVVTGPKEELPQVVIPGRYDPSLQGYRIDRVPAGMAYWRASLPALESALYSCASTVGPVGLEERFVTYKGPKPERLIAFQMRSRLYPDLLIEGRLLNFLSHPPSFRDARTGEQVHGARLGSDGRQTLVVEPEQSLTVHLDDERFEPLPKGPYAPGACHYLYLEGRGSLILETVDADTGTPVGPVLAVLSYRANLSRNPGLGPQNFINVRTDLGILATPFQLDGLMPFEQELLLSADGYQRARVKLQFPEPGETPRVRVELLRRVPEPDQAPKSVEVLEASAPERR